MAAVLDDEIKKLKTADDLSGEDDNSDSEVAAVENPEAQAETAADSNAPTPSPQPEIQDQAKHPNDLSFEDYSASSAAVAAPATPGIQTDPETGSQFVTDADTGRPVPHAELATDADKTANPPGGVELPKTTVAGTGVVPRAQLIDPDPDAQYFTNVDQAQSTAYQSPSGAEFGVAPEVRRAELVGAQAPDTLPQVEKAQPVQAPDTLTQTEKGVALPSKVQPAQPVTTATTPAKVVAPNQPAPLDPSTFTNPDGTPYPQATTAVDGSAPSAFILHHTSGRGTVQGVVDTLNQRHLGVEYVMDRDGTIYQTGGPGSANILPGWGPKGQGLNNSNVVGMEVIANDDKDVTQAQKDSAARFIAARYPNTPLYGHGEVNPGHKEEDEGASTKAAAMALRAGQGGGQAPGQATAAQAPPKNPLDMGFEDYIAPSGPTAQTSAATTTPAPRAGAAGLSKQGFYTNENPNDFVVGTATTFGGAGDKAAYANARAHGLTHEEASQLGDNGVGSPSLGGLDTQQAYGVAIPHEALIAQFGNSPTAWRTARVDVVNPQTGMRMRLPIVDVGPGAGPQSKGVAVDLTENANKVLGNVGGTGQKLSLKLVPNAGPDVDKNPQGFADEQAAIAQGINLGNYSAEHQVVPAAQQAAPGGGFRAQTPDEANQAATQRQALMQAQQATLQKLSVGQNLAGFYKSLDQPVPGVSDQVRTQYQAQVKQEITKEAQDYYNEPDPNKAFTQATGDANFGTFAGEVATKIVPNINQAVTAFNQSAKQIDENRVNQFFNAVNPNASPESRTAVLKNIMSLPDPERRAQITAMFGNLDPSVASVVNPADVADSLSRMSDPAYQAAQQTEIARQVKQNTDDLRQDPKLQNTSAGWWANLLAQQPSNIIQAMSGPVGQSLMLSQVHQGVVDNLKNEHPDWTDDKIQSAATASTLSQLIPQEVMMRLTGGVLGKTISGIENPAQRIATNAALHLGTGAVAGGTGQLASNVATGEDLLQGVGQAAVAGAVQAAPGMLHGLQYIPREGEPVSPTGEAPAPVRPPGEEAATPEPATPEPAPTEPTPTEPVRQPGPITAQDILGDHPEDHLDDAHVQDVVSTVSHNIFPDLNPDEAQELADRVSLLSNRSLETQRFQNDLMRFLPADTPTNFGSTKRLLQAYAAFRDGPTEYTAKEIITAQKAYNEARTPGTPASMLKLPIMSRDVEVTEPQAGLQTPTARLEMTRSPLVEPREITPTPERPNPSVQMKQARAPEPPTPEAQGSDQWTSSIANQFTQPRSAAGEIGEIAPGQGHSTQELVNAGLKMSPEEVTQHMSDLMHGTGDPVKQAAAVRAEEARLSQRSSHASQIAEANPGNPELQMQQENAFKDLTDFHNGPVAKLKNNWHAAGMAMQGEIPVDLSTYNGLRESWLRDVGTPPPASAEPTIRRVASRVKAATDIESAAMGKVSDAIAKTPKAKTSPDQVRDNIMKRLGIGPCIVP